MIIIEYSMYDVWGGWTLKFTKNVLSSRWKKNCAPKEKHWYIYIFDVFIIYIWFSICEEYDIGYSELSNIYLY